MSQKQILYEGAFIKETKDNINSNFNELYNTTTGFFNFKQYYPETSASLDMTTQIQNFLLYCQLQALQLKSTSLDDQAQRTSVTAYLPRGRYTITSPIIVPEYVNLHCDGLFVRTAQSGTITNFYTGDTTSKALINRVQPALMIVPRGHCSKVNIYCNSNGSDGGSGRLVGKNWTMYTPTLISGGSGYTVNDIITFANPSLSPYIAAQITVNSVNGSGAILTYTLTQAGAYSLPPVLQAQQWTSANGFTVFDSNGRFLISGGSGSGASFTANWVSDWGTTTPNTGGSTYYAGAGGIITDTILGNCLISQSVRYTDGTYGGTFADYFHSLNHVVEEIGTGSGAKGINFVNASDIRADKINPVNAGLAMLMLSSASIECKNVVIDTPIGNNTPLSIDNCTTINLAGNIFKRNINNLGSTAPATISLGLFSTGGQINTDICLDFKIRGGGAGGSSSFISSIGTPALYIANTASFNINVDVSNIDSTWSGQFPVNTSIVSFGANINEGKITGKINHAFGQLYSGTLPPSVALDIFDAEVPLVAGTVTATITGTATNNDVITLTFTNATFNNTYTFPRNVSYTVTTGLTTTQIATGIAAAINADAICQLVGIIATSSANVITISQPGISANNTVITSSVSGSATEIVTISNSGSISGSVSGGKLVTGGIYELVYNGQPINGVQGTGYGKAIKGSIYKDTNTGLVYINNNNATSPFWKPANGIAILAQAYPNTFHTGTGEFNLVNVKIPANRLSANGALRITAQWAYPNNANTKTMIIRHSSTQADISGGTLVMSNAQTTKASSRYQYVIQNSNSLTAQICGINNGTFYDSSGAAVVGAIDTTKDSYINFNINNGSAGDNSGLISYLIEWLEP